MFRFSRIRTPFFADIYMHVTLHWVAESFIFCFWMTGKTEGVWEQWGERGLSVATILFFFFWRSAATVVFARAHTLMKAKLTSFGRWWLNFLKYNNNKGSSFITIFYVVPKVCFTCTVRLLTHVFCKPTHFFFHSFIATMSYSLQTSFNSLMKDWADKYHVWGTPTRSPSRSNSR